MQRTPRLAGVIADYDRVLKQRTALLKSAKVRGIRGDRSRRWMCGMTSSSHSGPYPPRQHPASSPAGGTFRHFGRTADVYAHGHADHA